MSIPHGPNHTNMRVSAAPDISSSASPGLSALPAYAFPCDGEASYPSDY